MLYRNPTSQPALSFVARTLRMLGERGLARRRRLAELDLMSMSEHMKRDLGLDAGGAVRSRSLR